jgi:hypothetical protein
VCNMRSIFIGSALIVALNLAASYAVIALTAGAAPLLPERGITRQTVDRRHKADQWPLARQNIAPQSPAKTPQVSPILVGCDPIFAPPSGSAPVSNLRRCLV